MEITRIGSEGREIQNQLTRPKAHKESVGYCRDLLDEYRPNETYYLDSGMRNSLDEMGRFEQPLSSYKEHFISHLSWNSSRMEKNSYSLFEAERLLGGKWPLPDSKTPDLIMLLNHKAAIEHMLEKPEITYPNLCSIHALLSKDLLNDSKASGRLRTIPVWISGSVYTPSDNPDLLEECFRLIIEKANQIRDPFEQSMFLMVHLPYLQPFEDVNKRVSRLAMNIPLIANGLSPFMFFDMTVRDYVLGLLGVYELNRVELLSEIFYWGYQFSCALHSRRFDAYNANPFGAKYRDLLNELMREIVKGKMDRKMAWLLVEAKIKDLPEIDKFEINEIIKDELSGGLHMGNIIRYRLTPEEFQAWEGIAP